MAAGLLAYADTRGETPKVSFIHPDRRGDDIAETDAAGQLSRKNTYTEYGQIRQGPPPSPYGFLGSYGRFFDPQTSLYLLGARLYNPTLGRFLSRDPIPGGSANDYEYGAGNPVMNADPSGRFYGIASMCYLIVIGGGYDPMCAEAPPHTDPEPPVGGGSRMGDKLIYKDPMTGTYMIIDTRRGVIEARDLGRTAVVRKLWSKPSIEWSSVGKSFAEEIPF
jgi:RHS repeat-associated protein